MNAQNRLRVHALVLALLFSLALAGDIWISPSGTSTWDGICATTPVCSQAAPCALTGTKITSVEGSTCTLHIAGGSYGSTVLSLSFEPSVASTLLVTSSDSTVASILLHIDTHSNAFNVAGLNIKSSDLLFSSSNTATMVIENSNFELLGSDGSTTIGFVRSTSDMLPTLVRNSTFASTSDSIYYLTSFNQQDLTIEGSTFDASEVAILGASNSLSITNSTFRTPSLYQGEVSQLYLSEATFTAVSESLLLSTTTLTNLTVVGSSITGAGGFLNPDQLLSDPTLNLLSAIDIQNSTFGASFTLGSLYLDSDASVNIHNSKFAEVAASIILGSSNKLTITSNTFARKYNAPILAISSSSLDLPAVPIALYGNTFTRSPQLASATISLTNVTSFDALTNVTIDTLQVIGNVTVSGIWEIRNSISGSPSASIDFLVASADQPPTMTLYSITVANASLDLQAVDSLFCTVTNSRYGIQGPNITQGYAIYLSQVPIVTWDEAANGVLPSLSTDSIAYILASSLSYVPTKEYSIVGRFNYTILTGPDPHTAYLWFGQVTCPSQCDPIHTSACVALDRCSCVVAYGGPLCKCNTTGMPFGAKCSDAGNAEWRFSSSAVLPSLTLPSGQSIVADSNLEITGALNLPAGANMTLTGTLSLGGAVQLASRVLTSTSGSTCNTYTDVHIQSNGLVMGPSARINVNLDLSGITADQICNSTATSAFATFRSLLSASNLSSSAVISVNFTSSPSSSKTEVMQALESQLSLALRLVDSASASNSANPRVNVNAPAGSCASTSTSTPGTIDLAVQPCSSIAPTGAPSNGNGSKVRWWYWGIPVIVVGAILIIVLIVLLAVRPCCKK